MRQIIFVLALILFAAAPAFASHECGKENVDGVAVAWCIDAPEKLSNPDVLYYLHGGGGDEKSWKEASDNQLILQEWTRMGVAPPTVITISFGTEWLLSDVSHEKKPALHPLFVSKLMPMLENKIGGARGRRMLKGESMGGFNSAQLLLKNGELFNRAALVCPGISVLGPYSSQAEIDAFLEKHKAYVKSEWVKDLLDWTRWEFPSQDQWLRHDPLTLINTAPHLPKLYLSCGERDEYGFFDGAKRFAEQARNREVPVKWQPLAGGHCVADPKAIAEFLASYPRVDSDLGEYDRTIQKMQSDFDKTPPRPRDRIWVKTKLKHMFDADQYMRRFSMDTPRTHSYSTPEKEYFWSEFSQRFNDLDAKNTADLKELLKTYRWFRISEFGRDGDNQAWIIVQHADMDPAWQSEILSLLERLWTEGETNPSNYAYLYDRVAASWHDTSKRKPQRYGTQGACAGTAWEPIPIEDKDHLDERRKQVGLDTEAEYIKRASEMCR